MSTAEIESAMAGAMDSENRRRQLASDSPGLGALMQLEQVPYGPGVGISDVPLPVAGESHQAAPYMPQSKAYGPDRPVYAPDAVAGLDYADGIAQPVLRSAVMVVSAGTARPSLLSRLLGKLRR